LDLLTWMQKWDPTNFSFTVLVYIVVMAIIAILWTKVVPDYFNKERPFQRDLKLKRLQADIDLKTAEVVEQAKMRQAMEQLGLVAGKIALLVESHRDENRSGMDNVQALIRIVLEKQGVKATEIATFIGAQENENATRLAAAARIILESKGPLAS
jgi:hypothetical protein